MRCHKKCYERQGVTGGSGNNLRTQRIRNVAEFSTLEHTQKISTEYLLFSYSEPFAYNECLLFDSIYIFYDLIQYITYTKRYGICHKALNSYIIYDLNFYCIKIRLRKSTKIKCKKLSKK